MTEEEPAAPLTTEEEVKLLTVTSSRNPFQLLITRPLKELGKKRQLTDRDSHLGTEGLTEFRSLNDPNFELKRATLEIAIQSAEPTKEQATQSAWCRKVNSTAQTTPVTFLPELRQSIQEQDEFLQFCHKISERVLPVLESNMGTDVFKDQIAGLTACDDSLVKSFSVSQLKEFLSLKDARFNSQVQCIDWMPGTTDTVGISFASTSTFDNTFKRAMTGAVEHIFIWNFQAILHPQFVLESPSIVLTFKFCPSNPNIVVAGCQNGQVLLWDMSDESTVINAELRNEYSTEDSFSKYFHPKYSSSLFDMNLKPTKSHYEPICDLHWLPKESRVTTIGEIEQCEQTTQFATVGLEGKLDFWDINIDASSVRANNAPFLPGASLYNDWIPVFSMNLFQKPKEQIYAPATLFDLITDANDHLTGEIRLVTDYGHAAAFNYVMGPDRSLIGRQNPVLGEMPQLLYHSPEGFVPSPFVKGLYVGCDRAQIVMADMTKGITELFRSSARAQAATCIVFSPTRPSVFIVGKENGDIELWSVLDKSHECLFSQSVASSKVSSLAFGVAKSGKQLLCVGCGDGTLMIYKVPSFMSTAAEGELDQMKAFVAQQVKCYEQTRERFRIRAGERGGQEQTKEEGAAQDEGEKAAEEEEEDEKVDVELVQFEKEYARMLKDFIAFEKEQEENDK